MAKTKANATQKWLEWIKREDDTQCEWAVNYLTEHGYRLNDAAPPHRYLASIEHELANTATSNPDTVALLIKNMKAAWNAKENRSKARGRKAYSYVMSTDVEHKMRKLAGEKPINETLEGIIDREYQLYINEQLIYKANLQNEKNHRAILQEEIDALKRKLENEEYQRGIERERNKLVVASIHDLFLKLATQEIALRKINKSDTELTTEEQAEALKMQEMAIHFFDRKLRADIAAIRSIRRGKL